MNELAYLFPGQGAQSIGMGMLAAEASEKAAEVFKIGSDVSGLDLFKICREGPTELLTRTDIAQPAVLASCLAAFTVYQERHPEQDVRFAAGHSLGEYAALVAGGALTVESAFDVVAVRGRAMQAATKVPSGMVAVIGARLEQIEKLCDDIDGSNEVLQIAGHNSTKEIVLSGHMTALESFRKIAKSAYRVVPLQVSAGFHSRVMAPALEPVRKVLSNTEFGTFSFPVVSNVTGKRFPSGTVKIRELLVQQICSTVLWQEGLKEAIGDNTLDVVGFGPAKSVLKLTEVDYPHNRYLAVESGQEFFLDDHPVLVAASRFIDLCKATIVMEPQAASAEVAFSNKQIDELFEEILSSPAGIPDDFRQIRAACLQKTIAVLDAKGVGVKSTEEAIQWVDRVWAEEQSGTSDGLNKST